MSISELCDKQGLQPTVFYRGQKESFENGVAAFQPKAQPNHSPAQEWIAYLQRLPSGGCIESDLPRSRLTGTVVPFAFDTALM